MPGTGRRPEKIEQRRALRTAPATGEVTVQQVSSHYHPQFLPSGCIYDTIASEKVKNIMETFFFFIVK